MGNKNAAGKHTGSDSPQEKDVRASVRAVLNRYQKDGGHGLSDDQVKALEAHVVSGSKVTMNGLLDSHKINPGMAKALLEGRKTALSAYTMAKPESKAARLARNLREQTSTKMEVMLGTQAQHGLVMKKETPPTVQTTATPAKKNEKPTSGWAGDLGLRSPNK